MPLPVTQLDNRRFDDLAAEARQRLVSQLPELQQLVEGDPLYALTDLMAWMTETLIYRANLIPERQRRAFLNLLQIPVRNAVPAKGIVSLMSNLKTVHLPQIVSGESRLSAGSIIFSTQGEVQPTPLQLRLMIKEKLSQTDLTSMGISLSSLQELYGFKTTPFRPRTFNLGKDTPSLNTSLDKKYYVLLHLNDKKLFGLKDKICDQLAGKIINVGLAPVTDQPAEIAKELPPRKLKWNLLWQKSADSQSADLIPLEVISDSSQGCRKTGVVRIKLPRNLKNFVSAVSNDPKFAGVNNLPPEPPVDVDPASVLGWLCLTAPEDPNFDIGFRAVNAVEVIAQEIFRDQVLSIGNGRAGQVAALKATQVDVDSLQIQVSENGNYVDWRRVENFVGSGINDRVFQFDTASSSIVFGDGIRGMRPTPQSRIRAGFYRAGGGTSGNLPTGSIKQILSANANQLVLQQDWPMSGGIDAETVAQAEKRIPAELRHRDRAVTQTDFIQLAQDNPITPISRAEVIPGLMPGNSLESIRFNVPGVVSVFVMPPAVPALGAAPKPTAGILADVFNYLDQRKMLGAELYVLSPQFIPVAISMSVEVVDPTELITTMNALENNLMMGLWSLVPGGFDGKGWGMGREIEANELRTFAGRTPGVLAVNELRLFYQNKQGVWSEAQKISLQAYQLPELMSIHTEEGKQKPAAPDLVLAPQKDDAIAVPVIPDFC